MPVVKKSKFNLVIVTIISIPLLIIACAIIYYLVIYIPGKEQAKLKVQQQNKILQDKCISDADASLNYTWGMACFEIQNALGQKENPNCSLPSSKAQAIKKTRTDQIDLCLKRYPTN